MNAIQKVLAWILSRKWAERMGADLRRWTLRCLCGHERSVWDNGGKFNSFRDTNNNPSVPYLLVFQTKP